MATYSVRCRHNACRHRMKSRHHPDDMQTTACPVCGERKGWRFEDRTYNRRNLCTCSGPEAVQEHGKNFPHRTTHPLCDQHPHGFYNQACAKGVAHDDIPKGYHPMAKKDEMTRWDYFAAAALGGAAANPESGANSPRDLAHWAASLADSLMLERAKRMAEGETAP